jgi:hypothetical protein
MFVMVTRSRENYNREKNMGYAVAKTFLGMYVDARRAVCTIAEDDKTIDLAVEMIYAKVVEGRNGSNKCHSDFKTDKWKTGMNTAIDRFNERHDGRLHGAKIEIISTKDRKLLINAVGKFALNCKKNGGKFTKGMIRENIMGFKNAMCRSRYYRKPGRFITTGDVENLRERANAEFEAREQRLEDDDEEEDDERLSDEDAELPQRGFRGPNGETMCKFMKYNKCIKWDPDNDKVGVEYAEASVMRP